MSPPPPALPLARDDWCMEAYIRSEHDHSSLCLPLFPFFWQFAISAANYTFYFSVLAQLPHFLSTTVPLGDGSASHAGVGAKNDRQVLHQVHGQEWEPPRVQGKAGGRAKGEGEEGRGQIGSRGADEGRDCFE